MRIVILEAVTAGGLSGPVASGISENVGGVAVPVALRQEALAMVAALTADCCAALDTFDRGNKTGPISESEFPWGERCIPWLLASLFSSVVPDDSHDSHTVRTFWCPDDQNGSSQDRFDSNLLPIVNSERPEVASSSENELPSQVECWDPIRELRVATARVFLPGATRWDLPAGNHSQPPASFTTTPPLSRTRLEMIVVDDPAQLSQQWKEAVQNADAAILIAPQPDMQRWMAALGSLSHKVLSWPVDLLLRAEDKRYLTHVPSLMVEPRDRLWHFSTNDVVSSTVGNQPADPLLQWYAAHLATATTWALKPTNQCGGSDVWKISLTAPIADFETAKRVVRRLRERLPRETAIDQPLLWSPWVEGQPGSLLLLAAPMGWWCFPPCRQYLSFENVSVPLDLCGLVTEVRTVRYSGSELDPTLLTTGLVDLLWRQLASKLTRAERASIKGWFGIDFVAPAPDQVTLIEVNPRLTSSYNLHRRLRWTSK